MAVQRTYYCEGPDCGGEGGLRGGHSSGSCSTATPPPYLPGGFIGVRQWSEGDPEEEHHFCSWDCLMKFAAAQPMPERIEIGGGDDG